MPEQGWATRMGRSPQHIQEMCTITLEEARKRLAEFEKNFPAIYKLWAEQPWNMLHDTLEVKISTGTQSARERPAKPPPVSSILTPCSIEPALNVSVALPKDWKDYV